MAEEPQEQNPNPNPEKKVNFNLKIFLVFFVVFSLILGAPSFGAGVYGLILSLTHGLNPSYGGPPGSTFNVPEPYKSIFDEAGAKYQIQPAFVAAIFYAGEHGSSWPPFEEHAPIGSALNPTKHNICIRGPMQMCETYWPTWSQEAFDSPLPTDRIEWTRDAIFVGASHLSRSGAGNNTTNLENLGKAAKIYNHSDRYVRIVLAAYGNFYRAQNSGGGDYIPGLGGWHWVLNKEVEDRGHGGGCFGIEGLPSPTGVCAADYGGGQGGGVGSPVFAITDGTVSFIKYNKRSYDPYLYISESGRNATAGYNAIFTSSDNQIYAFYAHIYRQNVASQPTFQVKGGDQFATVYEWGKPERPNPDNSHLHFQLNVNGAWVPGNAILAKYRNLRSL